MTKLTRHMIGLLAGAVALTGATIGITSAQSVAPADQSEIQSIIRMQVDAFLADNSSTAFSFAAPSIKNMFGSDERFMSMVRQQYPQVFRPQSFEFGRLKSSPTGPVQEAYITGPAGKDWLAVYTLEQQADGSWKINGCYIVPDNGAKV